MKPGNLFFKVPNPAATKDEVSIPVLYASDHSVCAEFLFYKEKYNGKKIVYLGMRHLRSS